MLSDPHLLHVVLDLLQEVNVLYVRSFLCAQCLTTNHGLSLTYISLCIYTVALGSVGEVGQC